MLCMCSIQNGQCSLPWMKNRAWTTPPKNMPHYFIQSIRNEKILGQISVLTINLKVGHITIIVVLEKVQGKRMSSYKVVWLNFSSSGDIWKAKFGVDHHGRGLCSHWKLTLTEWHIIKINLIIHHNQFQPGEEINKLLTLLLNQEINCVYLLLNNAKHIWGKDYGYPVFRDYTEAILVLKRNGWHKQL